MATIALLTAACSGGTAATTTTTSTSSTTPTTQAATTTTTQPATSTTVDTTTTTTTSPGTTTTTLAGEKIDFGPGEGDLLIVIGVRHDDVLNLRAGPGTNQSIREEIPPTFSDLVAQGNTRRLPSSLWVDVDYEDTVGWVSLRFVGYEGETIDDTARVISLLGDTPVESSMTGLGELVADAYSTDDESGSDIVQVTPVTSGDLAEVTYDVVGFGDDAVLGVRIHVFAEKTSSGFGLKSVEATALCGRGVDAEGACT